MLSLYTTAIARLKLMEYVRKVEETPGCALLYVDTDSVIFKHPKGVHPISEGEFLGEMAREFPDCKIDEFCAAGPKF